MIYDNLLHSTYVKRGKKQRQKKVGGKKNELRRGM